MDHALPTPISPATPEDAGPIVLALPKGRILSELGPVLARAGIIPAEDYADESSRRLRFPHDREVIVTDTVGFIRDLPKDLVGAFRTTLDELRDADLLLHVVDASADDIDQQIKAVDDILQSLNMDTIPRVMVLNKCDRLTAQEIRVLCARYHAIGISALDRDSVRPLIAHLETLLPAVPSPPAPAEHPDQPPQDLALASHS